MDDKTDLEKEDKFTFKDKIVALLLIIIIALEIVILIVTVRKDKEENYFEVSSTVKSYSVSTSAHQGFPLNLKCSDVQKIDITLEKGSLFNKEGTLSALEENKYTVTCEEDGVIYWTPDDFIESGEIIKIYFKSDNEKYNEQEVKIQKNNNETFKLIE